MLGFSEFIEVRSVSRREFVVLLVTVSSSICTTDVGHLEKVRQKVCDFSENRNARQPKFFPLVKWVTREFLLQCIGFDEVA